MKSNEKQSGASGQDDKPFNYKRESRRLLNMISRCVMKTAELEEQLDSPFKSIDVAERAAKVLERLCKSELMHYELEILRTRKEDTDSGKKPAFWDNWGPHDQRKPETEA